MASVFSNLFKRNESQPPSDQTNEKQTTGHWTDEEQQKFVEALLKYGKDWQLIEEYIGTRSSAQIRSHAQKFMLKIKDSEDPQEQELA